MPETPPSGNRTPVAATTVAKLKRTLEFQNEPSKKRRSTGGKPLPEGAWRLTQRSTAQSITTITEVPDTLDVPRDHTAKSPTHHWYLLKLTNHPLYGENGKHKDMRMESVIRALFQDSWGSGVKGSGGGESKKSQISWPDVEEKIECRRIDLQCNGAMTCSEFGEFFDEYERYESDTRKLQEIYTALQGQRLAENTNIKLKSVTFYNMIKEEAPYCAKESCNGHPVVKTHLKEINGFSRFIGCSNWSPGDRKDHIFIPWEKGVNPNVVGQLLLTGGFIGDETLSTPKCAFLQHPNDKLKFCPLPHLVNGQVVRGRLEERKCPTRLTIYAPADNMIDFREALVCIVNPHSHCNFPQTKLSPEAKDLAIDAITAHGTLGATALKVKTAPTTAQLTGGKSLQEVHPGFLNGRRLQGMVKKARATAHPQGEEWMGLCDQREKDRQLPLEEQYVQACHAEGDIQLCIAMYAAQARIFHLADYLVVDFTFKRIYGDLNEWEIVVWHPSHNQRTTLGRFFCNKQSRDAFRLLWRKLFETVERLTNRPLRYAAIHKSGTLKGNSLDAEAAQVQGLGDELVYQVKISDPGELALSINWQSMAHEDLANYLAQLVTKLCTTHFNRDVDGIAGASDDDKRMIKGFPYLANEIDVKDFYIWCLGHSVPGVLNWYKNKVPYPWYFSGYNQSISPMPVEHWFAVPWHTNEAESAHPLSNRLGGTRLTALAAIEKSRKIDGDVMQDFSARDAQAIPTKKTLLNRLSHNTDRRIATIKKGQEQKARVTELENLEAERRTNQERNKTINATIKSLRMDSKPGYKKTPRTSKASGSKNTKPVATPSHSAPPLVPDSSPSSVPHSSLAAVPTGIPLIPELPPNFSSYTPAFQSPNTAFAFLSPPLIPAATADSRSQVGLIPTSSHYHGDLSQSTTSQYHGDLSQSDLILSADFDIKFGYE